MYLGPYYVRSFGIVRGSMVMVSHRVAFAPIRSIHLDGNNKYNGKEKNNKNCLRDSSKPDCWQCYTRLGLSLSRNILDCKGQYCFVLLIVLGGALI